MLEETTVAFRDLDHADRARLVAGFFGPLANFNEGEQGLTLEAMQAALERGEIERTPQRAEWVAAFWMLNLLIKDRDVVGLPESGLALRGEWLLNSTSGETGNGAGLLVMTAARESDASDEEWATYTPESCYYRAWMTDTGLPILAYDNFSGPPCRWDYSAGELAKTTIFGDDEIPDSVELINEVLAIAEKRRLI